jgi:hypothetical protein
MAQNTLYYLPLGHITLGRQEAGQGGTKPEEGNMHLGENGADQRTVRCQPRAARDGFGEEDGRVKIASFQHIRF